MVHGHGHSSYSYLDGVGSPLHRAQVAARLGQPALAITDHGHMNGALAHRKACQEVGIIPIIGSEVYWRPNRLVRDKEWRRLKWHLILLAKNLRGWHNLIKLVSAAYADGMYQFPCIDWDLQERHSEGIICTTSCVLGPLPYLIQNGTDGQVDEWVQRAKSIYGDDLFFSIMPHDFDMQRQVNLAVISLANRHGCPILHEKDSHYPERGWVETQKVAILTGINKTFAEAEEANRKRIAEGLEVYELWHDGLNISSEEEDRELYAKNHPDLPASVIDEAIGNTEEILRRMEPYLMDRTLKMPKARKGVDAKSEVLRWCRAGMKRIGKEGDEVYEQRLQYEAEVIDQRRAWDYFLLVGDIVRWARSDEPLPPTPEDPDPPRKRPIRLNTRGSAAASLICYLTQISTLDPITHRFKFERFINPERKSMPDIDIDIASLMRAKIKEYVARTFGRASVADIVAYQHFQPRAALKAVAKAIYGFNHDAFNRIAVLTHEDTGVIDPVHDTDLEVLREREPELDEWAQSYPDAWEHARRLENAGDPSVLRLSKHAAGVAILPGDVTDVMPTIRADESEVGARTAWAETSRVSIVDELGVIKADFLGLKGMDQQQMIVDAIAESTGEVIDLDALPPLRDPYAVEDEVMDIFRHGLTLGVNQFAGDGVREFMRRAAPNNVVDLTAVNAIYRPGPLGSGGHNRYVKRKNGGEDYEIPAVIEPILTDTFGCLVFQEQVMELFQVLVGYSAGQADDIRKEIDKLNRSKNQEGRLRLAQRHEKFIQGATEKLGTEEAAEELWQEILPYTGYAFNRPHAGSYSTQAYQDGWLKKHYPLFTYAVLLTLEEKKTALILRESRTFGVAILPPDVNVSGNGFTADRRVDAIRFGLHGIKGIGDAVADQVIADRPFATMEDFMERSSRKYSKVNKKARDILLRVGALDSFGARSDWSAKDRAEAEMELLGVALEPGGTLGEDGEIVRANVYTEQEVAAMDDGDDVIVAGKIIDFNKTTVKRGKQTGRAMATGIKLALDLDHYNLTCFPDAWDSCKDLIEAGALVMVSGRVDDRGKIIARKMMSLAAFVAEMRAEQEVAS